MEDIQDQLFDAIVDGKMTAAPGLVQAALDAGVSPGELLQDTMIPAMRETGALFEDGEIFVPEMLMSARAMQAGLEILKPRLVESGIRAVGRVVIGTVQGDVHEIGKNLVAIMMEGVGFEVIDLGVDVKPVVFLEAVQTHRPEVLGLSALLTTTVPQLGVTIQALREAGALEGVKVMVGGAPVTAEYAQKIGADGFAPDASQAAELARSYVA